jgi:hypothetical protein
MWDRQFRVLLPEVVVLHLESEQAQQGANWRGRTTVPFGPAPKAALPHPVAPQAAEHYHHPPRPPWPPFPWPPEPPSHYPLPPPWWPPNWPWPPWLWSPEHPPS